MKKILKTVSLVISIVSLAVILFFAISVFMNSARIGSERFETYLVYTNIASLVWFIFSPFWLISKEKEI